MEDIRYLALGDSYTIGEGVAEQDRWPMQLAAMMAAEGIATSSPRIVAATGWTTDELNDAISRQHFTPPYDLVSLLIGVNNQYRGRPVEAYREQFRALLKLAISFAGSRPERVLALSIPDWGLTRFAREQNRDGAEISTAIDRYNAAAHSEVNAAQARWIDITGISRAYPDDLTDDGLHPSAKQYAAWTQAVLPEASAALR